MFETAAGGPDAQPESAATASAARTRGKPQRRGSERILRIASKFMGGITVPRIRCKKTSGVKL
jgi:hypothetical protein